MSAIAWRAVRDERGITVRHQWNAHQSGDGDMASDSLNHWPINRSSTRPSLVWHCPWPSQATTEPNRQRSTLPSGEVRSACPLPSDRSIVPLLTLDPEKAVPNPADMFCEKVPRYGTPSMLISTFLLSWSYLPVCTFPSSTSFRLPAHAVSRAKTSTEGKNLKMCMLIGVKGVRFRATRREKANGMVGFILRYS